MDGGSSTAGGLQPQAYGRRALWLLLAALALWGAFFIFRTSFVIEGRRTFCLFDDAMISMTYARNLVEGHGLNWARQGDSVEGFTHPLWTALMVPFNLLPDALGTRSLAVQLWSLALLLLHVVLVRRLMLRHFVTERAPHWMPAALLTTFYYPLNYWALVGMETGLQALLTTASVLVALDVVVLGRDRHLELWLLATGAVLLRMDMLLMVVVVQLFVLGGGGLRRTAKRRWALGLAIFVGAAGGYELFRWRYFHDLLPNTFYLKLYAIPLDVRLLRGGRALLESAGDQWLLLLAVGLGTAMALWRQRPPGPRATPALALPAALFLASCAYSVYVGGDAWEMKLNVRANRFVAYAMPQVFILFNALLNLVLESYARRRQAPAATPTPPKGTAPLARAGRPLSGAPAPRLWVAAATGVALLLADGLWLAARPRENQQDLLGLNAPLLVVFHQNVLTEVRELRKWIRDDSVVATCAAGVAGYFSEFRLVDLLGYNDRHIAHGPPAEPLRRSNYESFLPGHGKWDYGYVLHRYRPDAFFQFGVPGSDVASLLRAAGYEQRGPFWLRSASPNLRRPAWPPRCWEWRRSPAR